MGGGGWMDGAMRADGDGWIDGSGKTCSYTERVMEAGCREQR
jgi:hypothetical protein